MKRVTVDSAVFRQTIRDYSRSKDKNLALPSSYACDEQEPCVFEFGDTGNHGGLGVRYQAANAFVEPVGWRDHSRLFARGQCDQGCRGSVIAVFAKKCRSKLLGNLSQ